MSSDTNSAERSLVLGWPDIWNLALNEKNRSVRTRALRDTITMVTVSLIPAVLGAFLLFVKITEIDRGNASYLTLLGKASLGGQLFLIFLSIAGSIFAKLWDPDGPKFTFSVSLNLFHLAGVFLTAGLLAYDLNMSRFRFMPVGLMSIAFFGVATLHYFILALPGYVKQPDIQDNTNTRADTMSSQLSERMKAK